LPQINKISKLKDLGYINNSVAPATRLPLHKKNKLSLQIKHINNSIRLNNICPAISQNTPERKHICSKETYSTALDAWRKSFDSTCNN